MIVCDTGPLVAAADADDAHHAASVALLTEMARTRRRVVFPATVLAEAGYLIERFLGAQAEAKFLRTCTHAPFDVVALTVADLARMSQLVEQYADMPLGTTDASVIAVAERLGVKDVATIDHRHFSVVRPAHCNALTLLPVTTAR